MPKLTFISLNLTKCLKSFFILTVWWKSSISYQAKDWLKSLWCAVNLWFLLQKKKDWLDTSVNKENHHGLVYSKDCDICQTEYWIIEYWIQMAQNLAPVWSAKSSNSCDPGYDVMEELWFFPCQPCYCCKYVSVKVVCGVVLRAKISQQSKTKSKLAGLPP